MLRQRISPALSGPATALRPLDPPPWRPRDRHQPRSRSCPERLTAPAFCRRSPGPRYRRRCRWTRRRTSGTAPWCGHLPHPSAASPTPGSTAPHRPDPARTRRARAGPSASIPSTPRPRRPRRSLAKRGHHTRHRPAPTVPGPGPTQHATADPPIGDCVRQAFDQAGRAPKRRSRRPNSVRAAAKSAAPKSGHSTSRKMSSA